MKCPDHDNDLSRLSNLGDTVDLVVDGFGTFGQADRETDPGGPTGRPSWPNSCPSQYEPSLRIAACKTAEGGSRDVAANVAPGGFALAVEDLSSAVERAG